MRWSKLQLIAIGATALFTVLLGIHQVSAIDNSPNTVVGCENGIVMDYIEVARAVRYDPERKAIGIDMVEYSVYARVLGISGQVTLYPIVNQWPTNTPFYEEWLCTEGGGHAVVH